MNLAEALKKTEGTSKRIRNPKFDNGRWLNLTANSHMTVEMILDEDWETEETWYENLMNKYPNGVFCEVRNRGFYGSYHVIVEDYDEGMEEFEDVNGNLYEYAKPLSKKYAPAFLEDIKTGGK